jgi:hypothetical protein
MNSSFRDIKGIHMFLHDFGSSLASMASYFPEHMPENRLDTKTPRVTARIEKNRGYVFINNYQRNYPLPERKNFQIRLKLGSGIIEVPKYPVDIPSGAYTMLPVDLEVGGVALRYPTAQPLCKLIEPSTSVFLAWPGVAPEFGFEVAKGESVEAPHARVMRERGLVHADRIKLGEQVAIRIRTRNGKDTQIVVLSREDARNTWKAALGGR